MLRKIAPAGLMSSTRLPGIVVLLAAAAFALNLSLALQFSRSGVVDQYDVLFNADPGASIDCIVKGHCRGRSAFSHPNLALFLNPPIHAAARLIDHTGLVHQNERELRRSLSLLVAPAASGAKAAVTLLLFLLLGLTLRQAVLLTVLSIVSFSQLIFGSIPDTFSLSGLLITLALLLALRAMKNENEGRFPVWIALGILITGITITNLAIVLILFLAVLFYRRTPAGRLLLMTAGFLLLVIAATASLAIVSRDAYHLREVSVKGGMKYTERWLTTRFISYRALAMPVTWGHTIASPKPKQALNLHADRKKARHRFRFDLAPSPLQESRDPVVFILLILFAAGALSYRYAGRAARHLCLASAVIIVFNWCLHTIWGTDLILYSQHWESALLVLMAGLFLHEKRAVRRGAFALMILLLVVVMIENGGAVMEILSGLAPDV